ncbi:transposable element Tcb1 transposase [Trichonephila clavipes]|nr:transposable element Tcb1 transposase [Trichonephila clavipes]
MEHSIKSLQSKLISIDKTTTIRHRLQQSGVSARRLLHRLLLTGNHRRLSHKWCDKRWTWTTECNDIVVTDESNFSLQHHDGRIRVWRHRNERMLNGYVMHRYIGLASVIVVWDDI